MKLLFVSRPEEKHILMIRQIKGLRGRVCLGKARCKSSSP